MTFLVASIADIALIAGALVFLSGCWADAQSTWHAQRRGGREGTQILDGDRNGRMDMGRKVAGGAIIFSALGMPVFIEPRCWWVTAGMWAVAGIRWWMAARANWRLFRKRPVRR